MSVLCFRKSGCDSQLISVTCCFSIPRRSHEEIKFDGGGAGVGFGFDGGFGAGGDPADGDDDIRHGLRSVCTRRARVIEIGGGSGCGGGEPGERAGDD